MAAIPLTAKPEIKFSFAKEQSEIISNTINGIVTAAEAGDPAARYKLYHIYEGGYFNLECDPSKAKGWLKKAAEAGHITAQMLLAHTNGRQQLQDFELREALIADAAVQYDFANLYLQGSNSGSICILTARDHLITAAEANHQEAQFDLGLLYRDGFGDVFGGIPDHEQAKYWLKKAADGGHIGAKYGLALFYNGTSELAAVSDETKKWLEAAAEARRIGAQVILGHLYGSKLGGAYDADKARKWFKVAARAESPEAQYNLANMCLAGLGGERNPLEAIEWLEKAATGGHLEAQFGLALLYDDNFGFVRDSLNAKKWFRRAAGAGHIGAQHYLFHVYNKEAGSAVAPDLQKVKEYLEAAARAGHIGALSFLARNYSQDWLNPIHRSNAWEWLKKAAKEGYPDAQYCLASTHMEWHWSEHVTNVVEGAKWLKESANAGYPQAQYKLAVLHTEGGNGVIKDSAAGIELFKKLAETGHSDAEFALSNIYRVGNGVPPDEDKAQYWLKRVAERGDNPHAIQALQVYEKQKIEMEAYQKIKGAQERAAQEQVARERAAHAEREKLEREQRREQERYERRHVLEARAKEEALLSVVSGFKGKLSEQETYFAKRLEELKKLGEAKKALENTILKNIERHVETLSDPLILHGRQKDLIDERFKKANGLRQTALDKSLRGLGELYTHVGKINEEGTKVRKGVEALSVLMKVLKGEASFEEKLKLHYLLVHDAVGVSLNQFLKFCCQLAEPVREVSSTSPLTVGEFMALCDCFSQKLAARSAPLINDILEELKTVREEIDRHLTEISKGIKELDNLSARTKIDECEKLELALPQCLMPKAAKEKMEEILKEDKMQREKQKQQEERRRGAKKEENDNAQKAMEMWLDSECLPRGIMRTKKRGPALAIAQEILPLPIVTLASVSQTEERKIKRETGIELNVEVPAKKSPKPKASLVKEAFAPLEEAEIASSKTAHHRRTLVKPSKQEEVKHQKEPGVEEVTVLSRSLSREEKHLQRQRRYEERRKREEVSWSYAQELKALVERRKLDEAEALACREQERSVATPVPSIETKPGLKLSAVLIAERCVLETVIAAMPHAGPWSLAQRQALLGRFARFNEVLSKENLNSVSSVAQRLRNALFKCGDELSETAFPNEQVLTLVKNWVKVLTTEDAKGLIKEEALVMKVDSPHFDSLFKLGKELDILRKYGNTIEAFWKEVNERINVKRSVAEIQRCFKAAKEFENIKDEPLCIEAAKFMWGCMETHHTGLRQAKRAKNLEASKALIKFRELKIFLPELRIRGKSARHPLLSYLAEEVSPLVFSGSLRVSSGTAPVGPSRNSELGTKRL
jgi:TPR repeat protein